MPAPCENCRSEGTVAGRSSAGAACFNSARASAESISRPVARVLGGARETAHQTLVSCLERACHAAIAHGQRSYGTYVAYATIQPSRDLALAVFTNLGGAVRT